MRVTIENLTGCSTRETPLVLQTKPPGTPRDARSKGLLEPSSRRVPNPTPVIRIGRKLASRDPLLELYMSLSIDASGDARPPPSPSPSAPPPRTDGAGRGGPPCYLRASSNPSAPPRPAGPAERHRRYIRGQPRRAPREGSRSASTSRNSTGTGWIRRLPPSPRSPSGGLRPGGRPPSLVSLLPASASGGRRRSCYALALQSFLVVLLSPRPVPPGDCAGRGRERRRRPPTLTAPQLLRLRWTAPRRASCPPSLRGTARRRARFAGVRAGPAC